MADPHFEIYKKLENMDNTLNAIKEASDLEPVLNEISMTLKNINDSLDILRRENAIGEYMSELSTVSGMVTDISSAVNFIAENQ